MPLLELPSLRDDCHHPYWAKERTPAGFHVCRICNPKPKQGDVGFL